MTVGILAWAYTLLLPSFADAGIVGRHDPERRAVGHRHAAAAGAVRARPAAAGAWRGLEPRAQHPRLYRLLAEPRAGVDRAAAGRPVRAVRPDADRAELPAVALVGDGRGTDHDGRALSRRGAHPLVVRELRREPRASASIPRREADFQLLRYAEHLLASAIGAASSRLVLSLLLRKRTVSTKAALKLLDDANAAIHYNREILQTALDHVRQGIAVFDKDLQLICWNRQFGEILDLPPAADARRRRARRDPALQRRARAHPGAERGRGAGAASSSQQYVSRERAVPRALPERGLVVEVRANRMPDGGIVTTFTDITPSVKAAEELERANETLERRVRERTERADPPQRRARPRQGRRRRGQHLEDPLPRRRQPRHPAAAQRRAALRHQPDRAPGQRRGRRSSSATSTPRSKRSRRSSARCSTSRGSTPAR